MPKEMVIVKLLLAKFIMVHHILEIKPTGDDKNIFQENVFPRNAVNILGYWIVKLS